MVQASTENVEAILAKGARRADDLPSQDPVNPRVAHTVVEDGSWVSDDVGQEYFAGLLLFSKSDSEDSDDGVFYATLAAGLTSNQIRMHHAIYHCFATNFGQFPITNAGRVDNAVWMSIEDAAYMLRVIEGDDPLATVSESFEALSQRGLIDSGGVGDTAAFQEIEVQSSIDPVPLSSQIWESISSSGLTVYALRTQSALANSIGQTQTNRDDGCQRIRGQLLLGLQLEPVSRSPTVGINFVSGRSHTL